MANYRRLRWFYDRWNDELLDARGRPVREVDATRNDIMAVELQVFDGGQFAVDSTGLIASGVAMDLTDYSNIVLGTKSQALYAADGAFTEALSGFDTTNTVHSLVNGRAAMLALFSGTPADYYIELELRTSSGNPFTMMPRPVKLRLHRDVIVGSETNMPSGVTASVNGTATISGTDTSVTVTRAGMTSTGQVILGMLTPSGSPTEPTYYESYSSGSFTINVSVAPGVGNSYNFAWTLVRLS